MKVIVTVGIYLFLSFVLVGLIVVSLSSGHDYLNYKKYQYSFFSPFREADISLTNINNNDAILNYFDERSFKSSYRLYSNSAGSYLVSQKVENPFVIDLRSSFWNVSLPKQYHSYTDQWINESVNEFNIGSISQSRIQILNQILKSDLILIENKFKISKSNYYTLSLGMINESGSIFIDDRLVKTYMNRYESSVENAVYLESGQHSIKIVINSLGNARPGFAHNSFIGFYDPEHPPVDKFPDTSIINRDYIISSLFLAFFSLLSFLVYLYSQDGGGRLFLTNAYCMIAFAISQSLRHDYVQSLFNDRALRGVRGISLIVIVGALFYIFYDILDSFVKTQSFFNLDKKNIKCQKWNYKKIFIVLFILLITVSLYFQIKIILTDDPKIYSMQFKSIMPFINSLASFSVILTILGLVCLLYSPFLSENNAYLSLRNASFKLWLLSLCLIIYVFSYNSFVDNTLGINNYPTLAKILKSQFPLIVAAIGILFMVAKLLRFKKTVYQILPDSIKRVAEQIEDGTVPVDRSMTDYNWLMLNDLVGSTQFKTSQIQLASHIFLSLLSKAHKDYLGEMIHFIESLGDAMLIALRSPLALKSQDPVLEKFVRIYALHRDGSEHLKDSYEAILALLKIENEELAITLQKTSAQLLETGSAPSLQFKFRTILGCDYYYYGLNHSVSNIDSKEIFKIAKIEKLVDTGHQGGLFLLSSVSDELLTAQPTLRKYFIFEKIQHPDFKDTMVAYLDKTQLKSFEEELESLTQMPIYLRSDATRTFQRVSEEIQLKSEQLLKITEVTTLAVSLKKIFLVSSQESKVKSFGNNFLEKNLLIKSLADLTVRLKLWGHPEHQLIKDLVNQIGIPAPGLIHQIEVRDHEKSPEQILKDLKSIDPLKRNRAIRELSIARVKTAVRPQAMDRLEFAEQALEIIASRPGFFSLEGHLYLVLWLSRDPERRALFKSITQQQKLIRYLEHKKGPSFKGILDLYQQWVVP